MPKPCCLQVQVAAEHVRLANTRVQPDCALSLEANQISQQQMSTASSLADILRRPHIHYRFAASVPYMMLYCIYGHMSCTAVFDGRLDGHIGGHIWHGVELQQLRMLLCLGSDSNTRLALPSSDWAIE